MEKLHSVMRGISDTHDGKETKARRDHMTVFREFLAHLDRASRKKASGKPAKARARRKS